MKKSNKGSFSGKRSAAQTHAKNNEIAGSRAVPLSFTTFDEKNRTIEAVMATEAPIMTVDFRLGEMVDEVLLMSGARFPEQVPLLDAHDDSTIIKQLGSTRNIRIDADKMIGLRNFAATPEADRAIALIKGGHLKDGSIRYRYQNPVYVDVGASATVGGKQFTATARPLRIATEWQLLEDSVCPIGADPAAKMRKDQEPKQEQEPIPAQPAEKKGAFRMNPKLKLILISRGLAQGSTDEEAAAFLSKLTSEEQTACRREAGLIPETVKEPTIPQPNTEVIRKEAEEKALQYMTEVRSLCEKHGMADIADEQIRKRASISDVKDMILAHREKEMPPIGVQITRVADAADKFRAAMCDGMLLRAGVRVKDPAPGAVEVARLSFEAVARECLVVAGIAHSRMGKEEILKTAMGRGTRAIPNHNTTDFPYILSTSANKAMLIGYQAQPMTYQRWCKITSLNDLKTNDRIRISDIAQLDQVLDSGELKRRSMSETREQYRAYTYGNILGITREVMINDDMGVFNSIFAAFGLAYARTVNYFPYALIAANGNLTDGGALFNSTAVTTTGGHANLATSSAAPSSTTMSAARAAMRKQVDIKGGKLNIQPRILLVGPEQEENALIVITSTSLPVDGMSSGVTNVHRNSAEVVVDAEITGKPWYLFADPMLAPVVEMGFLNGRQEPFLEERPVSSDILGTDFWCYGDFGGGVVDFRGAYKNAGE